MPLNWPTHRIATSIAMRCVYCCNALHFFLLLTALRFPYLYVCVDKGENTRFSVKRTVGKIKVECHSEIISIHHIYRCLQTINNYVFSIA